MSKNKESTSRNLILFLFALGVLASFVGAVAFIPNQKWLLDMLGSKIIAGSSLAAGIVAMSFSLWRYWRFVSKLILDSNADEGGEQDALQDDGDDKSGEQSDEPVAREVGRGYKAVVTVETSIQEVMNNVTLSLAELPQDRRVYYASRGTDPKDTPSLAREARSEGFHDLADNYEGLARLSKEGDRSEEGGVEGRIVP